MKSSFRLLVGVCIWILSTTVLPAQEDPPRIEISNRLITAKIYLPDIENGFYRGTRFDWSGVIYSLKYNDHEFFGEWQQSDDPFLHDRITGPVEEFLSDGKGLGYDDTQPGGPFIRIGVGVCEKPDEEDYRRFHTYRIVDPGERKVRKRENWVEFYHTINPESAGGYGYVYSKRIELLRDRPGMTITHLLDNTGEKTIRAEVYNHNFFVIDNRPTGPEFRITVPWTVRATHDLKDILILDGRSLGFLRELAEGEEIFTGLEGFGDSKEDNRIRIYNREVKAGVLISTDQPLVRRTCVSRQKPAKSSSPGLFSRRFLRFLSARTAL